MPRVSKKFDTALIAAPSSDGATGLLRQARKRMPRKAAVPMASATSSRMRIILVAPRRSIAGEASLDRADGLQLGAGVNFVLAEHRGLAAEAFDDRTDVGPDVGAGQQDRAVAGQRRAFEDVADAAD